MGRKKDWERRGKGGTEEGAGRREKVGAGGRQRRGYSIESIHLWPSRTSPTCLRRAARRESARWRPLLVILVIPAAKQFWSPSPWALPVLASSGVSAQPSPSGARSLGGHFRATSADRQVPTVVLTVCVETAAATTLFPFPCWLVDSGSLKNPCINNISGDSRAGLEWGLKMLRVWGSGTWKTSPRFLVHGQMVNACEPQE